MSISILQWNIWYKQNIKDIASFLLKNKADIICLQELMYNYTEQQVADTTKYLAEALGYNYCEKAIEIEGETWQQANGIFTRFPIVKQNYVWINEPLGSDKSYDNEYRVYLETVLDVEGKHITVATTHMSYTHKFLETDRKRQETDRLAKIIKTKKTNYLLTGDLNASPDSYTVRRISHYLKNVGPTYDEKTWDTKSFSYNGFEADELAWRIDYIFASKDVKVIDAKILKTNYSDHLPIFAKLRLDL